MTETMTDEDSTYDMMDSGIHKTLAKQVGESLEFVEQRMYSSLDHTMGYTPEMVDQFIGKKLVKTKWDVDPQTGEKFDVSAKIWSPVEWWIYHEWSVGLSKAQRQWAAAWSDLNVLEHYIRGGRGSGKSYLGALFTLWGMVFLTEVFGHYMVALFSGSKDQSRNAFEFHVLPQIAQSKSVKQLISQYDKLREWISGKKSKSGLTDIELNFTNGARIKVNPTSTIAARSRHPDLLWIDEAVEAETQAQGKVIDSAISSQVAGTHQRMLATSTIHKNPMGWMARNTKRAENGMRLGEKHMFAINLSTDGLYSKPWLTPEQVQMELKQKQERGIDIYSEFYGEIVGGHGDAFLQDYLKACIELSTEPPKLIHGAERIIGHDPAFGTSMYGLVVWQITDSRYEILYSDFFARTSLNDILPQVEEIAALYDVDEHAVDAAGTSTIQMLEDQGYDVTSYALGARPREYKDLDPDEQEAFNKDVKTIGVNFWNNEILEKKKFRCHPNAGALKPYNPLDPHSPRVYANQLLIDQMQSYSTNPNTGKLMKGNDDMIDAANIGLLHHMFGSPRQGRAIHQKYA